MSNDEKLPLSVGSALERERERMVRLRESKEMTAPAKPDIDEQIARAKRDVDLAAGWLAANQTDVEAQHNYQFCVSILATLEAHKRIIEAAEVPEPVAWMAGGEIWNTQVSPYKDGRGYPLYGPDLLAAYDRVAAEYRKSGGTNKYEGHTLHEWWERAINAERQLARCQKECEEQARLNGMGSEREARLMAQLAELRESEGG